MNVTYLKYPRNVTVNFRKLNKVALTKILRHYGVEPKKSLTQNELAILVARIFEESMVLENDVVDKMAKSFCYAEADAVSSLPRNGPSGSGAIGGVGALSTGARGGGAIVGRGVAGHGSANTRDMLNREPASQGEQVAAKNNEEGTWILGNVLEFDPRSQTYQVQDEDDAARIMTLPFSDVRRLEDSCSHLRRGDNVLAVFPETTSFYRAIVAKNPKSGSSSSSSGAANGSGSGALEVVVKFEDDEDENGKSPARRVPARFVLRRSDIEDGMGDDDSDDDV